MDEKPTAAAESTLDTTSARWHHGAVLDFEGDVCPRDRHALRDGACPQCG